RSAVGSRRPDDADRPLGRCRGRRARGGGRGARRLPRDARRAGERARAGWTAAFLRRGGAARQRPLPRHRRLRRRQHRLPAAMPAVVKTLTTAVVTLALLVPAARATPPSQGVVTGVGAGAGLFAANCSRCHGNGDGLAGLGPSLRYAGAGSADFYLRTGYMPLADPHDQPERSRPLFSEQEIRALIGYVASIGHGPPIPTPNPERGDVAEGQRLFLDHCAGCHQIAAEGGYLTGARVPPLHDA